MDNKERKGDQRAKERRRGKARGVGGNKNNTAPQNPEKNCFQDGQSVQQLNEVQRYQMTEHRVFRSGSIEISGTLERTSSTGWRQQIREPQKAREKQTLTG